VGRVKEDKRRKKIREGRKVAKHYVFPMFCGPGGSKSRIAKAAGAEPSGEMRGENLHAVVAKHIWKSKCYMHVIVRILLEVEMSKKCTALWREEISKLK
jgi:hypothetical protein